MKIKSTVLPIFIAVFHVGFRAAAIESIADMVRKQVNALGARSCSTLFATADVRMKEILNSSSFKRMAKTFNLNFEDQKQLVQFILDRKKNISSALLASMAARELFRRDQTVPNGLDEGISSIVRMASLSGKSKATEPNLKLTIDEMNDAREALNKKIEYSPDMLLWSKADVDVHIAVMTKTSEIHKSLNISPEESLVLAIMQVKNVDKETAMKIIRKLKDCA